MFKGTAIDEAICPVCPKGFTAYTDYPPDLSTAPQPFIFSAKATDSTLPSTTNPAGLPPANAPQRFIFRAKATDGASPGPGADQPAPQVAASSYGSATITMSPHLEALASPGQLQPGHSSNQDHQGHAGTGSSAIVEATQAPATSFAGSTSEAAAAGVQGHDAAAPASSAGMAFSLQQFFPKVVSSIWGSKPSEAPASSTAGGGSGDAGQHAVAHEPPSWAARGGEVTAPGGSTLRSTVPEFLPHKLRAGHTASMQAFEDVYKVAYVETYGPALDDHEKLQAELARSAQVSRSCTFRHQTNV